MSNIPQSSRRVTAAVLVKSLLWLWLVCLSVLVFLGYQMMDNLADRNGVDTDLKRLEAQVTVLTETTQALQQRPAAATAAGLQDTRQALESRIGQIEQAVSGHASTEDLRALRTEVEQIQVREASVRAAAPAQSRVPNKASAKPAPPPLPFRVVGAELRAGQRSVSVAPATGDFTADQVQVLLPGDALGPWRLQAIDGSIAVFQAGEQTRRVAIP